jgi:hypothetical protein
MPRPPDSDTPRSVTVAVRLTPDEAAHLDKRAAARKMTRSALARALLTEVPLLIVTPDEHAVEEARRTHRGQQQPRNAPEPTQSKRMPRLPTPPARPGGANLMDFPLRPERPAHGPTNCTAATHPIGHGKIACKSCGWSGTP